MDTEIEALPEATRDRTMEMPGRRLLETFVPAAHTGGAYSLFAVVVAPGSGERAHIQHGEDECFYVLEGQFSFTREAGRMEAGPGAHLYVPKGDMHAYSNVGAQTGRLLVVFTPGGSHERFVEEVGEPVTGGGNRPLGAKRWFDAAQLFEVAAWYGIEMCEMD